MKRKKISVLLISVISISFVIICWLFTYYIFKDSDNEYRGSFGSMFGGIESLFSGLAFCGIIITILQQSSELKLQREEMGLQREEMRLQREEMIENRKELERTTKAQQEQSKSLNRQAENLKISARLAALNSLASYYTEVAKINQNSNNTYNRQTAPGYLIKANDYIKRIEEILDKKENG